jgi:glycosyltransferase involved in cell wall biosynthesis
MHIAHATATFFPYPSGTGRVCLLNALGAAGRGHRVTVLTSAPASPVTAPDPPGLTVIRLKPLLRVGNAPLLPGLLRPPACDVLHLHYPFVSGQEMLALVCAARRIPLVITYHQDLILSGMIGRAVMLHEATLGRWILTHAARLLVTSRDYFAASRIARFFTPDDPRVAEMPNGVDTARFHPGLDGRAIRDRYGIAPDAPLALFVGGLDTPHYFKGVDVLLKALARLEIPDARLMLVGDGDLRLRYEHLAAELGIAARVTFCGRVPDADLPQHYAACDLLVLPSTTMGEAFGIVLLEAMACGKPVIASNLPGVRTVVDPGVDGLLAEPGSVDDLTVRLDDLIARRDQHAAMGQRGRDKAVRCYDWERINERLLDVYAAVVAERR